MRVVSTVIALALALSVAAAQSSTLRPAQLQEDFDTLRRAVEEAHGGLYRFTPRAELSRLFDATRGQLDRPMTRFEFHTLVSEALSAIRDGHTRLELDDATTAELGAAKLLPLRVTLERGRLIVASNDTVANTSVQPGMELVSINGRPVPEIVAAISKTISPDGFIETGKASRLARSFPQLYWLVVEQGGTFTVVAKEGENHTVLATLNGVTTAERGKQTNPVSLTYLTNAAKLDSSRETISLTFLQGDAVGVLRIRAFEGATFVSVLSGAFDTLASKKSTALILDLRGNGGGVDMYGVALVSQFMRAPFQYFDRVIVTTVRPSFATWNADTFSALRSGTTPAPDGGFLIGHALHPAVGVLQPASRPFTGKLVVLIDGGTFSTSADVCAQLRSRTDAVFVGEETGGAAEGNTSGLNAQIVLPHSGMKLKVQMYGYWNAFGQNPRGGAAALPAGRGIQPDYTVVKTVADTLQGVDAGLKQALAVIRK
ncbi:MAG TPA: S41 family peptidase [Vicinamibacterales bacterium]|nr:S41 family peptidase [Vicinamibacterales bacterium]